MPANGRWDLIRSLKVKLVSYALSSMEMGYLSRCTDQMFTTEESVFISWERNEILYI